MGNRRFFYFLLLTTIVAAVISCASVLVLYNTAFDRELSRLTEIAQNEARLIEAVARFDQRESGNFLGGGVGATISQIRDAHWNYNGFGETGEFTLASREGDQMVFILSRLQSDQGSLREIPFDSYFAEPMRRALSGQSGTVVGPDYRGVTVMAAYEPVAILDLGIVSKIDLAEFRFPFLKAAGVIVTIMLIVVAVVGSFLHRIIKQQLAAEQEIIRHRDQLEEQVAERTAEVVEKANQLEKALSSEREYSLMQREFVSMVSHEFRTPLSIIDGAAQRMSRRVEEVTPEELLTRTTKIRGAVVRMTALIESSLSTARIEAGTITMESKEIDLASLVTDVFQRQNEISPQHNIVVEVDGLVESVWGDENLLDQVFTNLASNAVKYSPGKDRIEVTGRQENNETVITVRDYGVGIPVNELPKLFKRYFRASTASGIAGTGIGLCLVKELVEMHGGHVDAQSDEGWGSTFTVRLPVNGLIPSVRADDKVDELAAAARVPSSPP